VQATRSSAPHTSDLTSIMLPFFHLDMLGQRCSHRKSVYLC
jgi:hypothetical protein